jgi:transposase
MEFFGYLKSKLPTKLLVMLLDNARYQHCQPVKDLALELGSTLLFLPAYSPNLNLIERRWKLIKKKVERSAPALLY